MLFLRFYEVFLERFHQRKALSIYYVAAKKFELWLNIMLSDSFLKGVGQGRKPA